ncbi:hypothetical protein D3C83_113870 [compost metagenome]
MGFERVNLVDQDFRIDDHAIADDAELVRVEGAGRDQMQDRFLAVDHQRMAGVVAALKADDDIGVAGKQIDDLAFTLVAPLGTDDCDV